MRWPAGGCIKYDEGSKTKLHYKSISPYSYKANFGDSITLRHFFNPDNDSVLVYRYGVLLSHFKSKAYLLNTEVYQELDSNETVRALDSFYVSGKGASKAYFNYYFSRNVRLSKTFFSDGARQTVLYYSSKGTDSIYKEWYNTGILKTVKRFRTTDDFGFNHYPHSEIRPVENSEYYPNGILARKQKQEKNYTAEYWKSGILKYLAYDTLINKQNILVEKHYYPDKKIKSIHFFQEDKPCCTWLDYSKKGILTRVEKAPVYKAPHFVREQAYPEIFTYVEESPEFPRGFKALETYLETELANTSYKYPDLLAGSYSVILEITEQGKAVLVGVKGFESQMIVPNMQHIIENMPNWKPRRANGRAIPESYKLILTAH